ncbi:MAG: type 1 glutamine amidotransferase [Betaproteobacteria bacterium]|nr:type 1 glutamine amidotransferase [Betaproteobacteria bacterium]
MKPVAIFRHTPIEGPGYLATFLDRHFVPWQLVTIDDGATVPADPGVFSGLAFMGGPMSVNDPIPWMGKELALICAARARDIPVIGHCLGGQLMAKAFGATVARNPVKEIGWGEVRVLDNPIARAWFGDLSDFTAFHWHGETFGLPTGATNILSSTYCAHQAFVLGSHLGMQCHIEMTEAMIISWCKSGAAEIAACATPSVQQATQMQAGMTEYLPQLNTVADRLYTRWIMGLSRS